MQVELKPCPFCGETERLSVTHPFDEDDEPRQKRETTTCEISSRYQQAPRQSTYGDTQ